MAIPERIWQNLNMAIVMREVARCDQCGYEWLGIAVERCKNSKCRKTTWNSLGVSGEAKERVIAIRPLDVDAPQKSIKNLAYLKAICDIPKVEREQVRPPEIAENAESCRYTEYDGESGETYGCYLPLGHRLPHKRGARL